MNLLSGFGSGVTKSLVIRFIADTARASRKIDMLMNKIQRGTSRTATQKMGFLEGLLRKTTSGFNEMGEAGEAAFSKIAKKATVVLGILVAFGYSMRQTFKFGTLVENSLVALEVLQGSTARAQKTMKDAMRFSLLTPFTPSEVFSATQAAAQYNIDLYKKGAYGLKGNQNVAQILAGMGSFVDLSGNKIGMARAAHAVMRGDYRLLRQYRGLVSPAFETAKQAGKVGTPQFTQKFIEELGKIPQIMEMAKKQSETVSGLWSTISGTFEEFWMKFSGAGEEKGVITFWSRIRETLLDIRGFMLNLIDYIGPGLTEIGSVFGSAIKEIWFFLKAIFNLAKPLLKVLWAGFRMFVVVLEWIFNAVSKILDFFGSIFSKIGDVINALFDLEQGKKKKGPGLMEDVIAFLKFELMIADTLLQWALNTALNNISNALDMLIRFLRMLKSGGKIGDFLVGEKTIYGTKAANRYLDIYPESRKSWGAYRDKMRSSYREEMGEDPTEEMMERWKGDWIKEETKRTGRKPSFSFLTGEAKWKREAAGKAKPSSTTNVTNIYNETNPTDLHNNFNNARPDNVTDKILDASGIMVPGR